MTQQKVNKRGWVKNAAIIFLSVLLVLTFFSNTIANRYLPEVASQQVAAGTLSVQIRGQGTVAAAESFEVKSSVSRKVMSVPVKVGDPVSVGDTLIIFSEAASDELKAAQDALDALVLNYQKALINATSGDYSAEKRAIQNAQLALDEAKAKRDKNVVTDEEMNASNNAVSSAEAKVASCEAELYNTQTSVEIPNNIIQNDNIKDTKVVEAKNKLVAIRLLYKNEMDTFNATAERQHGNTPIEQYKEYLAMYYIKNFPATDENGNESYYYRLGKAYNEIKEAEKAYTEALRAYAVTIAENNLQKAKLDLTTVKESNDKLKTKKADYDSALKEIDTAQWTLNEAMQNLEKSAALESLDLANMKKEIDTKRAELEALQTGGEGSTVKSEVNGIVNSVSVSAGNTAAADTTLMVVEVPDLGYTLSFPVSTEQSQRVRIGESATILYNYWGVEKTANLVAITTNPENPTTSKLLVFKLGGEIASGEQLTISVGEKGSNYDAIVPNSAIRTDSNGDFVLAVEAKSSVLGNRFTAVRVDVKVLAKDDTNTAVTGGLTTADYVITHSSKPIEPGMRVRLPD